MSKPELPIFVEPLKLADRAVLLEGEIALSKLERIRELSLDDSGSFSVSLQFAVDEERHRIVKGRVAGSVTLECQRCLQLMQWPVDSNFTLAMVFSDQAAVALPRAYEPWLLESHEDVSLIDMIEDEVLLSVPVQASHPEGECSMPESERPDSKVEVLQAVDRQEKTNPFSVLAELKNRKP